MGAGNTKLEDDLWAGSGAVSRYKSSTNTDSHSANKQSSVPSTKGETRPDEKPNVDDPNATNDPDGDILDRDPYDPKTAGPIFPNGEINWDCPCLGGAAHGPCGTEFRDAFSCFHHSKEEVKGSDCFQQFREMSTCFSKYPDLYGSKADDDDEEDEDNEEEEKEDVEFDQEELDLINQEDGSGDRKQQKVNKEEDKDKREKTTEEVKGEPKKSRKATGEVKQTSLPLPGSQQAIL